ncbi:glutamate ABC transporter substrate-binding protein [Cellulomonas wangsupingiae]|uniref:Glutamate ABC transporter substrate-binding protein n=1 Tax=Cellulomonas wangsupingiae TaxID=2968085 RepID=A0ABY5KDY5_9CELL|nr:glutamate ABC transporter substrate-binding protein [Cellulomonas wangsupingiae]MCC2335238.1 glutamate ABC transporter substrate-binding protein [Cellulomonas wangsupingiae]MCM0639142.1 glutamate ABC transporter substrate-binding protein [Cellulomonas wangsupingiae]UUI66623.1 glutamate ABC transporter substrate-binding protein [Cellulomonas wangsupingiae]
MRAPRLAIALTAVAALTLGACAGGGDEPEETAGAGGAATGDETAGAEGTLRIGIKFDQPGLGYQDGSDYTGFDVAVATYVADKLGYGEEQIEWVQAPSAQRETMLQNGQVDMIFATYSITDKRKEVVAFAGPYFVAGQDLLVAADDDSISGPEDLEGKNLCSVTGSTSAQRIKDEYAAGTELLEQPGYAECVTALVAGTVDAVTTDDIILAGLASVAANEGKVKVVGNPFSEENYGVGLAKDSDFCEDVNAAITEMIEDGSWQSALDDNVGASGYQPNEELNPPTVEACA